MLISEDSYSQDKRISKVMLWGTLKLVCFCGDFHDFEFCKNLFTRFLMTTSGLRWLLEIIPLLRKKFHGPTTSTTISMVAEAKNYWFLKIRTLRLAWFWVRDGLKSVEIHTFSDESWDLESSRKFSSDPMIMFWVFKTFY